MAVWKRKDERASESLDALKLLDWYGRPGFDPVPSERTEPPPARPVAPPTAPRPALPAIRLPHVRPAAVATAAALAGAVAIGLAVSSGGSDGAQASRQAPAAKAKPEPAPGPKPARTKKPPSAPRGVVALPPFVWAPVDGATAYEFRLVHGGTSVFSATTAAPRIRLGARLRPGTYRWYVWPVVNGQRQHKAVVQATLAVRA